MLTIPSNLSARVAESMDIILNSIGRICTLYYPPIQSGVSTTQLTPVGAKTLDLYSDGGNYPIQEGQGSALEFGQNFINLEQNEKIIMTIQWFPDKFDNKFPQGNRYADGTILTRGYVTDLQKVLNCNYMETYKETGFNHYRFKLLGEPTVSDQFTIARYFYAYWKRI